MQQKNYEDLFFTDDFLFCKIMTSNESICRRVIEVLLGFKVQSITYLNKQEELKPDYFAHGIRLDVVAKDTGKIFNLEMQTNVKENLPMRARYYQAVMDVESLGKRRPYSELPDSYIVFICLHDPFDGGLPRYTVKSTCIEDSSLNEKISDKILKVYYNATEWNKLANDDDEKAFLKFLVTQKPESKLEVDIMEQVMYARGQEPWRIEFMQLEELKEEGRKEGYEEGYNSAQAEISALKARLAKYEPVEQSDMSTPANR